MRVGHEQLHLKEAVASCILINKLVMVASGAKTADRHL